MKNILKKDIHSATFQEALYNSHYKRIYNTCLRIIGNVQEAEEAMQDTFLKIFSHINTIQDEKSFYPWSQSIAIRTAIDRIRKEKIYFEPVENLSITEEESVDEEEIQWTIEKVKQKISDLPDGYRVVLSMRLFENCEFEEIAKLLNVKEVSVRSQYIRGKQRLQEQLKLEMK